MENQQTQVKMTLIFKWMLQEQHAMSEVVAAVERLVQQHRQFDRKDVITCYVAVFQKGCRCFCLTVVATDGL